MCTRVACVGRVCLCVHLCVLCRSVCTSVFRRACSFAIVRVPRTFCVCMLIYAGIHGCMFVDLLICTCT